MIPREHDDGDCDERPRKRSGIQCSDRTCGALDCRNCMGDAFVDAFLKEQADEKKDEEPEDE